MRLQRATGQDNLALMCNKYTYKNSKIQHYKSKIASFQKKENQYNKSTMHEEINELLKNCTNLDEVRDILFPYLKEKNTDGLAFVSGLVTTPQPDKTASQRQALNTWTADVRKAISYPAFSFFDIFSHELLEQIKADTITTDEWLCFMEDVLVQGGVTDLYLTPGWTKSTGCRDEYITAVSQNIKVVFFEGAEASIELEL